MNFVIAFFVLFLFNKCVCANYTEPYTPVLPQCDGQQRELLRIYPWTSTAPLDWPQMGEQMYRLWSRGSFRPDASYWAIDNPFVQGATLKSNMPEEAKVKNAIVQMFETVEVPRRSVLAWKMHENGPCAMQHCPDDSIEKEEYHVLGCGGPDNKTWSGIWWDHGVAYTAESMRIFHEQLRLYNITYPYLVLDIEIGLSNWEVHRNYYTQFDEGEPKYDEEKRRECARLQYKYIQEDPRFDAEVLPQLLAAGFEIPIGTDGKENRTDMLFNTVSTWRANDNGGYNNYLPWNTVMEIRVARYYNQSFYWPAAEYDSTIQSSDYYMAYFDEEFAYEVGGHRSWYYPWPDSPDTPELLGATPGKGGAHVGTYQSRASYMGIPNGQRGRNVVRSAPYNFTGFNALRNSVNSARMRLLSKPDVGFVPWLQAKRRNSVPSITSHSQIWDENNFHHIIGGIKAILYWNVVEEGSLRFDKYRYAVDGEFLRHSVGEAEQLLACADYEYLEENMTSWVLPFFKSSARVESRIVSRISVDYVDDDEQSGVDVADNAMLNSRPAVFLAVDTLNQAEIDGIHFGVRFTGASYVLSDAELYEGRSSSKLGKWVISDAQLALTDASGVIAVSWCNTTGGEAVDSCGMCYGGETGRVADQDRCGDENLCFCEEFEAVAARTATTTMVSTESEATGTSDDVTATTTMVSTESEATGATSAQFSTPIFESITFWAAIGGILIVLMCVCIIVLLVCGSQRRRRRRDFGMAAPTRSSASTRVSGHRLSAYGASNVRKGSSTRARRSTHGSSSGRASSYAVAPITSMTYELSRV